MLFRQTNKEIRNRWKINLVIYLLIIVIGSITLTGCKAAKGSIVILEQPDGAGFSAEFADWSSQEKCDLHLNKDDEIQIDIYQLGGEIELMIIGENGNEPYKGNNLDTCSFTVKITESDEYSIRIIGEKASGTIDVDKAED